MEEPSLNEQHAVEALVNCGKTALRDAILFLERCQRSLACINRQELRPYPERIAEVKRDLYRVAPAELAVAKTEAAMSDPAKAEMIRRAEDWLEAEKARGVSLAQSTEPVAQPLSVDAN